MEWEAVAPANLALIKYMGKREFLLKDSPGVKDGTIKPTSDYPPLRERNVALNSSLSLTLPYLLAKVRISKKKNASPATDEWQRLNEKGFQIKLSLSAQERFVNFFAVLKKTFHIKGCYKLQSGGNFPLGCGLASSAAGFAALTLAAFRLAKDSGFLKEEKTLTDLAHISRRGSGSSCRSFFSPWCLWQSHQIQSLKLPNLLHQAIVLESRPKTVSSSEAHRRVLSSPRFPGRPERAEKRLKELIPALKKRHWEQCYRIVWQEFSDMHELFETACPPFSYRTASVNAVLKELQEHWRRLHDGPLVTMDAGSTIHLLFRQDQKALMHQFEERFRDFRIFNSPG